MSDEHTNQAQTRRTLPSDHPLSLSIMFALMMLASIVLWFSLRHFSWAQKFQERHLFWAILLPSLAVFMPIMYLFRRKQRLADQVQFRVELRGGRIQRMPLAWRCVFLLGSLGMIVTSSLIQDGAAFLVLGAPVFVLFAVEELIIILRPGDTVPFTNPRDELLAFFKARALQLGYLTAILSMAALCLVSLFATRYVGPLLLVGLTISLLAPSLFYNRLDRQAEANE